LHLEHLARAFPPKEGKAELGSLACNGLDRGSVILATLNSRTRLSSLTFFFFAFESVLTMNSSFINFDLEVSQKKNFDLE
jgi:hypothetical protein